LVVLLLILCSVETAETTSAKYRYPQIIRRQCPRMEDYVNGAKVPMLLRSAETHSRYIYRPWHNTGLGHTIEVYNLALKMAMFNNLTLVHTPLALGHGPFRIEPEDYFGFGRGEVLPSEVVHLPQLQKLLFPTPEMNYKMHQNLGLPLLAEYAQKNNGSNILFEIPSATACTDQDSDFSQSGAWFRNKFEAQQRHPTLLNLVNKFPFYFDGRNVNIAVHIRRGDALKMGRGPHSDLYYIRALNQLIAEFGRLNITTATIPSNEHDLRKTNSSDSPNEQELDNQLQPRLAIHIFTDGSSYMNSEPLRYVNEKGEDAELISKIECTDCVQLHIGGDALVTFHHLVTADIMVSAISMFSNTAAILTRSIKVLASSNRTRRSLPNVVVANDDGGLDPLQLDRFHKLWKAYYRCWARMRQWPKHLMHRAHTLPPGRPRPIRPGTRTRPVRGSREDL